MKQFIQISFLLGFVDLAFAGPKLAKDLPPANSSASVDVIVQFKTPPTKDELKQLGPYGQMKKIFNSINAVNVTISPAMLATLEADPNVRYISPNRSNKGFLDLTTAAVNATVAWQYGWDGTGVGVAVIDSGIALKHDLTGPDGVTSRVVYSQSFVAGQSASDAYGHGTHVAGIVGSSGKDSSGSGFLRTFKGVAPNVNLINLRVLDQNGAGQEADVISAIQQAINLKTTYNIRVINLSLGRPVFESYTLDPLCQAAEAAWKAGIVVVTAAGNYGRDDSLNTKGYGTIASPGNDPYVITVGAMKTNGTAWTGDDTIASYSSKGPTLIDHIVKPDLVAPGNKVISLLAPNSTLAANYPRTLVSNSLFETLGPGGKSGDYFELSGTSMAAPVVSGAAALLIQQHPSLTPDQVKARLMKTATKALNLYSTGIDSISLKAYNSQSDIFTVGAGYLNISAALSNNDLVTMPAVSPTVVYNSVTKNIGIVRNFSIVWGDSMLWGDASVFGNIVFSHVAVGALDTTDISVLWGDTVCWGDSTTSGFSVIWGDTVNRASALTGLSADDDDQ
jgi:serine protease AprX